MKIRSVADKADSPEFASERTDRATPWDKIVIAVVMFVVVAPVLLFFMFVPGLGGPGHGDNSVPLVSDVSLMRTSASSRLLVSDRGDISVPDDVLEVGWNDRYILCHQYGPRPDGRSVFPQGSPVSSWWILDTESRKVYARLTFEAYERKLRELGVPDSIELRSTESL